MARSPEEFDRLRLEWDFLLQTCPRPTFIGLAADPVGSNESALKIKNKTNGRQGPGIQKPIRTRREFEVVTHTSEVRSVSLLRRAGRNTQRAARSGSTADAGGVTGTFYVA